MRLYTGFDLHSSNSFVGIIDENGKRAFHRKLPNDPGVILDTLRPFKDAIVDIAVESTYNWYWLVDLLMAEVSFKEKNRLKEQTHLVRYCWWKRPIGSIETSKTG